MAIYDTMQYNGMFYPLPCNGSVLSMGSLLAPKQVLKDIDLCCTRKAHDTSISGGYTGQATDVISAEEILRVKKELTQITDLNTKGKTFDELAKDMERDNFDSRRMY